MLSNLYFSQVTLFILSTKEGSCGFSHQLLTKSREFEILPFFTGSILDTSFPSSKTPVLTPACPPQKTDFARIFSFHKYCLQTQVFSLQNNHLSVFSIVSPFVNSLHFSKSPVFSLVGLFEEKDII